MNLFFYKWREDLDINNSRLFDICQNRPLIKPWSNLEIFPFDRGTNQYDTRKLCDPDKQYKDWTSNVYSTLLPVPSHRDYNEVCIEHFYSDADLKKEDEKKYRLYTTDEFDALTGNHKVNDILFRQSKKLKYKYPKIRDSNIRTIDGGANIALSKKAFANHIFSKDGNFKDVSFEYFRPIFELFREIIEAKKKNKPSDNGKDSL